MVPLDKYSLHPLSACRSSSASTRRMCQATLGQCGGWPQLQRGPSGHCPAARRLPLKWTHCELPLPSGRVCCCRDAFPPAYEYYMSDTAAPCDCAQIWTFPKHIMHQIRHGEKLVASALGSHLSAKLAVHVYLWLWAGPSLGVLAAGTLWCLILHQGTLLILPVRPRPHATR